MQTNNIIEALRNYFLECELLGDHEVSVNSLPERISYTIDALGGDPFYKRYVDGGGIRQFNFSFTSNEYFDGDARTAILSSGFVQALTEWIDANNESDVLPEIKDRQAIKVEVTNSGFIFTADIDLARYQIQARLLYE